MSHMKATRTQLGGMWGLAAHWTMRGSGGGVHLARAKHSLARRSDDTGVTSTWLHGITVIAVATQNTTRDTHTALGRPALTPPACWDWELDEGVMALVDKDEWSLCWGWVPLPCGPWEDCGGGECGSPCTEGRNVEHGIQSYGSQYKVSTDLWG